MAGQGTIIATGSIDYPVGLQNVGKQLGVEKVMTMTSTYDHRIIQGAESGRFLKVVEEFLQGEHEFYEKLFADLGVQAGPKIEPPTLNLPTAAPQTFTAGGPVAASTSSCCRRSRPARRSSRRTVRTATSPPASIRSAPSPRATRRSRPDALNLTPELMSRIPSRVLRVHVEGESLSESLPEAPRGLLRHDRVRGRAHLLAPPARLAARADRVRHAPHAARRRRTRLRLLDRLIAVDAFERFMHKAYLGQKQFSIEGLDMTVPMIDELIWLGAHDGAEEVVVGMAHRGRLSVLTHNLNRAYDSIFAEFEGASTLKAVTTIPQGGTGDVKYHHGAAGTTTLSDGSQVRVHLESNPSHLEFVHPVVAGAARAVQTQRDGDRIRRDTRLALPIVLHGDAAFPGQGVVAETLNLQGLDGYNVGGTIHLIQNNQVGFTTDPDDSRSHALGVGPRQGLRRADHPRQRRRRGGVHRRHPPGLRVPQGVRPRRRHRPHRLPPLRSQRGRRARLHAAGHVPAHQGSPARCPSCGPTRSSSRTRSTATRSRRRSASIWQELTQLHQNLRERIKAADGDVEQATGQTTGQYTIDTTPGETVTTAVPADTLREINEELLRVPEGFTVHPKLLKTVLEKRRNALGEDGGIDWAHAESLALRLAAA